MAWIFQIEDGQTIPSVRYQAILESGFTDYTNDIVKIDKYYNQAIDFKKARDLIKGIVAAETNMFVDWATYPQQKKDIAIKWVVAPYALRVPAITDEQDKENWRIVIIKTEGHKAEELEGRARIYEEMRMFVAEYVRVETLSLQGSQDFYYDTKFLLMDYIAANSPDFKYWLCNEVGTEWEFDGYNETTYIPTGIKEEIKTGLLAIYNGEY